MVSPHSSFEGVRLFQAATFHQSIAYRNWFLEIVKKLHLFFPKGSFFVVNTQQFMDSWLYLAVASSLLANLDFMVNKPSKL
jgi:hypothetical protein